MPRVRIDLKPEAYEALAARAIEERRPIDWQAEVLIESGLGLRDQRKPTRAPITRNTASSPVDQRPERVSA
jgi:hypothetical protein